MKRKPKNIRSLRRNRHRNLKKSLFQKFRSRLSLKNLRSICSGSNCPSCVDGRWRILRFKKIQEKKKEKEAAKPDPDADYVDDEEDYEYVEDDDEVDDTENEDNEPV
ncbi:secreted protein [gut metagenome]|uniref:Secreted protein n=1 Tax=gut metagenome TaxID=749906 RepID=J9GR95_9ZZZZ